MKEIKNLAGALSFGAIYTGWVLWLIISCCVASFALMISMCILALVGMTISSITIKVTPWWQTALLATECTLGAPTAVSAGMLVASVVINRRKKSKSVPVSSDD